MKTIETMKQEIRKAIEKQLKEMRKKKSSELTSEEIDFEFSLNDMLDNF